MFMGYTGNRWMDTTQNVFEIPKHPGYYASEYGHILNGKGKLLRQFSRRKLATKWVQISGRPRAVNYLVLTAFTGYPPCKGYFVRHLNGDRSDSRLENLVWAGSGVNKPGLSWQQA